MKLQSGLEWLAEGWNLERNGSIRDHYFRNIEVSTMPSGL